MNTFSTEYMSQTIPVGISSNIINGIPRNIQIPIKKYKISKDQHKCLREIQQTILKLTDLILKIN